MYRCSYCVLFFAILFGCNDQTEDPPTQPMGAASQGQDQVESPTAGNEIVNNRPDAERDSSDASSADSASPEDPSPNTEPDEAQTFINISNRLEGNGSKKRYGIAITDIDDDGDFEAVVTGYGASNEVWDLVDGRIVDIAPSSIKDPSRKAIGVGACDMDGDGREELYFLNVDRFGGLGEVSDRLFRREGDGWVDVFESTNNVSAVNRFSGRSVMCFDRDGDGQFGVFVANYGGPMKLFEADDQWQLIDVAPELGMALTTGGRSLVNLPEVDGRMRLFAGNENGPNFFFTGTNPEYENIAELKGIDDPYETVRGVAVLDADEDGRLDLVYGNWDGPHRLFLQRDDRFENAVTDEMTVPSRIRTVIAADFDNDGYEEIFWNNIGEPNRLFKKVDGEWVEADMGAALEPDGLGTGAAIVDIDGDGRLELFVAHGESGEQPLSLFRWGANSNHFLRVNPLTSQGGAARGAIVKLITEERQQLRVIDAGSGYLCQMEPVAHFGLGQFSGSVSIEVRWPDGTLERVDNVEIDQTISVPYPR